MFGCGCHLPNGPRDLLHVKHGVPMPHRTLSSIHSTMLANIEEKKDEGYEERKRMKGRREGDGKWGREGGSEEGRKRGRVSVAWPRIVQVTLQVHLVLLPRLYPAAAKPILSLLPYNRYKTKLWHFCRLEHPRRPEQEVLCSGQLMKAQKGPRGWSPQAKSSFEIHSIPETYQLSSPHCSWDILNQKATKVHWDPIIVALISVIWKTYKAFKTVTINSTLNCWIDFSFIKILL